jgi:hypothetical protein
MAMVPVDIDAAAASFLALGNLRCPLKHDHRSARSDDLDTSSHLDLLLVHSLAGQCCGY